MDFWLRSGYFWSEFLEFWSSLAVEAWNFDSILVWRFGKDLISKIVRWISKEDIPLELGSPQPYF